jgi:Flp pilus assembly protein TadG
MSADLTCRLVSIRALKGSRRLKGEAGASLVEYALVFIVSMTILFGIIGFGHMLYAYHFVDHAAKEAARWAAVNGLSCNGDAAYSSNGKGSCTAPVTCTAGGCTACTGGCASALPADITNYVTMITPTGLDPTKITVAPSWPGNGTTFCATVATQNSPGCPVQVQVGYAFHFIVPLLPGVSTTTAPCTNAGLCLSSTSAMVVAH